MLILAGVRASGWSACRAGMLSMSDSATGWSARPVVPELEQGRTETPKEQRVPWDFKRFVSQSSKFIELPSLLSTGPASVLSAGESFPELELYPLDDVVMGGASASSFDNDSRTWAGEVTSLNSGGFVGIRCKTISPALDLSATRGVALKLRSDGSPVARRFKLILRDSTDFNGVCWTASFTVGGSPVGALQKVLTGADAVETVRIAYSDLVPTIFAKTVPDVTLDLSHIVGVQLALSKFEYDGGLNSMFREGSFELEVLDVATY